MGIFRLVSPLIALVFWLWFNQHVTRLTWFAHGITLVGIIIYMAIYGFFLLLKPALWASSAVSGIVIAAAVAKFLDLPGKLLLVFNFVVGAISFFFIALYLYGIKHFEDLLQPQVNAYVILYICLCKVATPYVFSKGIALVKCQSTKDAIGYLAFPLQLLFAATFPYGSPPDHAQ